jgi:DNA repair exonuclease SbcCD ATPase subunit
MATFPTVQIEYSKSEIVDTLRTKIAMVNNAKYKLNEKREELKDLLLSDKEYSELTSEIESKSDRRREVKKILKDTQVNISVKVNEIKELNQIYKELKKELSGCLEKYVKHEQMTIFDGMIIVKNFSLKTK